MNLFRLQMIAGAVLALVNTTSGADAGHGVPAGVSSQQHVHLFEALVVSPTWLAVLGVSAILLLVVSLRRRKMARLQD